MATGLWTEEELDLHIDFLEVKVVQLTLTTFKVWIEGEPLVLMSDNATVVAYMKKWRYCFSSDVPSRKVDFYLGSTVSGTSYVKYIPGKKNVLADQFNHLAGVLHRVVSSSLGV